MHVTHSSSPRGTFWSQRWSKHGLPTFHHMLWFCPYLFYVEALMQALPHASSWISSRSSSCFLVSLLETNNLEIELLETFWFMTMNLCVRGGEPKPTNVKTTFGHDVGLLFTTIGGNLTKHDINIYLVNAHFSHTCFHCYYFLPSL